MNKILVKKHGFIILNKEKYKVSNTYNDSKYMFSSLENLFFYYSHPYEKQILFNLENKIFEISAFSEEYSPVYKNNYIFPILGYGRSNINLFTIMRKLKWDDIEILIKGCFPVIQSKDDYKEACKIGYYCLIKKVYENKLLELNLPFSKDIIHSIIEDMEWQSDYDESKINKVKLLINSNDKISDERILYEVIKIFRGE